MTFKDKLLTYLGFCPSKESAQRFRKRNNTITIKQGVVGVGFILISILLVNANNIYASTVTIDTILRLFNFGLIIILFVIVMVGGLIVIVRQFGHDPWALAKFVFPGKFIWVLVQGATSGLFFISPTDGWVEIIIESLAISLMSTFVLIIVTGAYFRWRKDKE